MFNFKEELTKYQESLSVEDLSEGLSGDEIQDILDVAQALARQPQFRAETAVGRNKKEKS